MKMQMEGLLRTRRTGAWRRRGDQVGEGEGSISPNGTISCDGAIAGKLSLVTFAPGTRLINHGGSSMECRWEVILPASQSSLQQSALEGSNASPMEGVVQLISAQRAAVSMRHALRESMEKWIKLLFRTWRS